MTAFILVVDDEEPMRIALELLMSREGHRVETVPDGNAALAAIREKRPDLVLLDVELPGRSGFEVCQSVKQDPAVADTMILILSARSADADIAKGLALGADAFLGKPFSTSELLGQVDALLNGRSDDG